MNELQVAVNRWYALVVQIEEIEAWLLERNFRRWQEETVMPEAVNRWIREIGEDAR